MVTKYVGWIRLPITIARRRADLLTFYDEFTSSPLFYSRYHLLAFCAPSSRTGQSAERSGSEGDVKAGSGDAERSKRPSETKPRASRDKEKTRGNVVPSQRRGSATRGA